MAIRVAIVGSAGRMGKSLIHAVHNHPSLILGAATEFPESKFIGVDAGKITGLGELNVIIKKSLLDVINDFDVIIDFTRPEATLNHLNISESENKPIVIGTTGIDEVGKIYIQEIAKRNSIVFSPNMSVGVNLCLKLLDITAKVIGKDADINIIEAHHRHKVDAPSGTALRMGEVIAEAIGYDFKEVAVYNYGRRKKGDSSKKIISFETIRAGDIVGEHTIWFTINGERIELTHKASSREIFAIGAVRAACWIANQKRPGLYDMQDVLGLN